MDEYQRLTYLESMGVPSYVPRLRLPGAKPSVRCALPVPVHEQIVGAAEPPASRDAGGATAQPSRSPAADIQSLLDEQRSARLEPADTRRRAAPRMPAAGATISMQLYMIPAEAGWLLIDDVLPTVPQARQLRFLSSLLFALTGKQSRLEPIIFRWPPADNPRLDTGEAAAAEALQASVLASIERMKPRVILVMSDSAARFMPSDAELFHGVPLITVPGSVRVFEQPSCKAELWSRLRELRQVPH